MRRSIASLSLDDTLRILTKFGVKKAQIGDIWVEFDEKALTKCSCPEKLGVSTTSPAPVKAQAVVSEARKVASQLRRKEDIMNELLLTDPAAYEAMLESGELGKRNDATLDGDGADEET